MADKRRQAKKEAPKKEEKIIDTRSFLEKHGSTVASQWAVADKMFNTILDNTI